MEFEGGELSFLSAAGGRTTGPFPTPYFSVCGYGKVEELPLNVSYNTNLK